MMRGHVRMLSFLHMLFGLVGACAMGIGLLAIGGVAGLGYGFDLPSILSGLGMLAFVLLVVMGLGQAMAGYGLLKGWNGARGAIVLFGVLGIVNLPLGTLLGCYTLWVLGLQRGVQQDGA